MSERDVKDYYLTQTNHQSEIFVVSPFWILRMQLACAKRAEAWDVDLRECIQIWCARCVGRSCFSPQVDISVLARSLRIATSLVSVPEKAGMRA